MYWVGCGCRREGAASQAFCGPCAGDYTSSHPYAATARRGSDPPLEWSSQVSTARATHRRPSPHPTLAQAGRPRRSPPHTRALQRKNTYTDKVHTCSHTPRSFLVREGSRELWRKSVHPLLRRSRPTAWYEALTMQSLPGSATVPRPKARAHEDVNALPEGGRHSVASTCLRRPPIRTAPRKALRAYPNYQVRESRRVDADNCARWCPEEAPQVSAYFWEGARCESLAPGICCEGAGFACWLWLWFLRVQSKLWS